MPMYMRAACRRLNKTIRFRRQGEYKESALPRASTSMDLTNISPHSRRIWIVSNNAYSSAGRFVSVLLYNTVHALAHTHVYGEEKGDGGDKPSSNENWRRRVYSCAHENRNPFCVCIGTRFWNKMLMLLWHNGTECFLFSDMILFLLGRIFFWWLRILIVLPLIRGASGLDLHNQVCPFFILILLVLCTFFMQIRSVVHIRATDADAATLAVTHKDEDDDCIQWMEIQESE